MNNKKLRESRGFTLLEILLVVGILAVLVLLGMRVMHSQSNRSRIERAGQELQSTMQAAIYYHSVNHTWPDDNAGSSCSTEAADSGFAHYYLPQNDSGSEESSSFETYYCWKQHNTDGNDYENAALFDLYLSVKGASACQKAKQIAATVPNAHAITAIDGDASESCGSEREYWVRAQIVPSAQSIHNASGQSFRAIGQCTPDASTPECGDDLSFSKSATSCCHVSGSSPTEYKIHFPACDRGQTQKVVYLPAFITYMHNPSNYSPQNMYDRDFVYTSGSGSVPTVGRSRNPDASCYVPADNSGELVCTIQLGVGMKTRHSGIVDLLSTAGGSYAAGSVGAVYVASCASGG